MGGADGVRNGLHSCRDSFFLHGALDPSEYVTCRKQQLQLPLVCSLLGELEREVTEWPCQGTFRYEGLAFLEIKENGGAQNERLTLQYGEIMEMFPLARDWMVMEEVGRESGGDSRARPARQKKPDWVTERK